MATTVNYKGNTITTINGETKILTTNGKWLEDDIEIIPETPDTTNVTITDTTDAAGGTIREITTSTSACDEPTYTTVDYNNSTIASFSSNDTKTLTTKGIFVENDFNITSDEPDITSINVTKTVDTKGGTIADIEVISEADRFFNTVYPKGKIYNNDITNIGDYQLYYRKGVTGVYSSSVTTIGSYAFQYCTSLKEVYLPSITTVGNAPFSNCKVLKGIVLPKCTSQLSSFFCQNGYQLEYVDLMTSGLYSGNVFQNCYKLTTVVLRSETLVTNNSSNAFGTNIPLTGRDGVYSGHIYVPQALIEEYQTATNWATMYTNYPDIFQPIEGSIYETCYADGTIINEYDNLQFPEDVYFSNFLNINYPQGQLHSTLTSFNSYVANGRTKITSISNEYLTSIGDYAFQKCSGLVTVNFPSLTTLGGYSFLNCSSLTNFDLSNLTSIGNHAFDSSGIKKIILTHDCTFGTAALGYTKKCQLLVLRSITTLASDALRQTGYSLRGDSRCVFDLGEITSMSNRALYQTNPKIIIFRNNETVCSLSSVSGSSTCLPLQTNADYAYTVYVPQVILSDYQNATNWSTLLNGTYQITLAALEGSKYEDSNWYLEEE